MRLPAAGILVWISAGLAAVSVGIAARPLPRLLSGETGGPPAAAISMKVTATTQTSLEPILALSPFGRLEPSLREDVPATETTLGLMLHGVIIAMTPERSAAIVSGRSTQTQVYTVGDGIEDEAILESVHGDHVELRVGGRTEILSFPKAAAEREAATAEREVAGDGVAALRALVTGGGEDPEPEPDYAGNTVNAEATIDSYRERIRDNPQTVLDSLGLSATDDGYRVEATAPISVLRAGFRPGDVVASVNGQQVGNIETDRHYFNDVAASGHARIEILRKGRPTILSFPLK